MTLTSTSPIDKFSVWFEKAKKKIKKDPNAMVLSTCGMQTPDSRVVLMKSFDDNGFVFYTNYNSQKGEDLRLNDYCSLLFYWPELGRQVRIQGIAKETSEEESSKYFNSRHIISQYGAMVSPQSQIIKSRWKLIGDVLRMCCFPSKPSWWGGYRITPFQIEFWEEGPYRLHNRERYTLHKGQWIKSILAP